MDPLKFEILQSLVIKWADEKEIYSTSTVNKQFLKAVAEMGEVADALAKCDTFATKDEIGDVLVCLINVAHMMGTTLPECLGYAYAKIAQRKGRTVRGVFIKEEDVIAENYGGTE